ncbi:hypothetical protein [Streptomyces sp. UH6]|uniref:hypothetical protein n=1 Tax=Streptomyces sp. UH6 TaxID=2748379 RepID=UPI0015D4FB9D|nr:hypothetical protein [Streptomyces sp. UH6]NYV72875.1 hypothetical protein [Streptomyces sp. UH6]
MRIPVLPEGARRPSDPSGPPLPPPAWADVDRCLAERECERRGPDTDAVPEAGVEFDVVGFDRGPWRPTRAGAGRQDAESVAVSMPPEDLVRVRHALDTLLRAAADDAGGRDRERLASLRDHLDATGTVRVTLPEAVLRPALGALRWHPHRARIGEEPMRALDGFGDHVEQARPVTSPWQEVLDTLRGALREALSRPGRQGLLARDELLGQLRAFADVHRGVTAADDREQRRLQAERTDT